MTAVPCQRCDGDGRIANTMAGEPWPAWANLPPESALAVRLGVVAPVPCPDCSGAGKIDDTPAPAETPAPDAPVIVGFSPATLRVTVMALYELRHATLSYIRGYDKPSAGHDVCCQAARAQVARRAEERAVLEQQLQHVDDVLRGLGEQL